MTLDDSNDLTVLANIASHLPQAPPKKRGRPPNSSRCEPVLKYRLVEQNGELWMIMINRQNLPLVEYPGLIFLGRVTQLQRVVVDN